MKTLYTIKEPGNYGDFTITGSNRNSEIGIHIHVPKNKHIHFDNLIISNVFIPLVKTGKGLLTWNTLTTYDFGGDNMNIRTNGNVEGKYLRILSNTPTRPYNFCVRKGLESIEECLIRNNESVYDSSLLKFEVYNGVEGILGYHVDGILQTYATGDLGYPVYTDGTGTVSNIDIANIYANLTGTKTQGIIGSERCRYTDLHLGYESLTINMDGYPYTIVFNSLDNSTIGCTNSNTTKDSKLKILNSKDSPHKSGNNIIKGFLKENIIGDNIMDKPDMRLSSDGMFALLHEEGLRTKMYKDSEGYPTIGVGHLITEEELELGYIRLHSGKNISIYSTWSKDDVMMLLRDDLHRFRKSVNRLKHNLNQKQFDALISFAFNIGVSGFERSTAYRRVKAGNHKDVPNAMMMWRKPKSIIGRRKREADMYYNATITKDFIPKYTKASLAGESLTEAELEAAKEILG